MDAVNAKCKALQGQNVSLCIWMQWTSEKIPLSVWRRLPLITCKPSTIPIWKIFRAFDLCWGRVDGCPPPIFRSPVYTPWATSLKAMTLKLGEDLGSRNLIRYLTWIQNEFEEKQRSKDILWSIQLAFHLILTSSFKCLQLLPLHIGFKFTPKMTQLQFMTYSWTQLCGFIHYNLQTYLVWVVVWH